jgi:hypothetical protein
VVWYGELEANADFAMWNCSPRTHSVTQSGGGMEIAHFSLSRPFEFSRIPRSRSLTTMADTKDKVKDAIDRGAKKAKDFTDKAADKARDAAKRAGESIENAGKKIKDAGK